MIWEYVFLAVFIISGVGLIDYEAWHGDLNWGSDSPRWQREPVLWSGAHVPMWLVVGGVIAVLLIPPLVIFFQ